MRIDRLSMFVAAILLVLVAPHTARAQETISGEVWLGGTLFTIEDLENLTEAAALNKDQKDAALELMRGGMARARTISLKAYRRMDSAVDEDDQSKDWEQTAKLWEERQKKQTEEVVEIEKSVLSDLKALLEPQQVEEGWGKFERSRRRLLLRSTQQVLQEIAMFERRKQPAGPDGFAMPYTNERGATDLVAIVRASKLNDTDRTAVSVPLDQYTKNVDMVIAEYRSAAKPLLVPRQGFVWPDSHALSDDDVARIRDSIKRMNLAGVRAARMVEDTLKGDGHDRFMRQRLRVEKMWEWQPCKRQPQVRAVLRLRSLTNEQREKVNALVKAADAKLAQLAAESLRARDNEILADKQPDPRNPYDSMNSEETQARMKNEQKVRSRLVKDMLALLDEKQRQAYETGIESDQDLAEAFERRRHGTDVWSVDQELQGWSYSDMQGEDEADQK